MSATVRPAPLTPEHWRHLAPGDPLTLHEGRPAAGTATVIEFIQAVPDSASLSYF
ncbi:hypothetical protein ACFZB9_23795 [Kitasatospora sp. NPDC008050]|uniref:hypothetical protein n=1 Tax=Kitasatospora sp. NPDC008050 TaxID=3364021 RepID=UPI0036EDA992